MVSNFKIQDSKIFIKNKGEFYGFPYSFIYDIGNKLYEFATMESKDFKKLNTLYKEIIKIVCTLKEGTKEDLREETSNKLFSKVEECLKFSPYTHFYTQALIDIIVKTYDTDTYRTDLLYKYKIGVLLKDSKYSVTNQFTDISESPLTFETMIYNLHSFNSISETQHLEYIEFFNTIKNLLIENLQSKKVDLKRRLELISEYSNNPLIKNLSIEERLYFYEAKRIFNLNYTSTNPNSSIFLDTNFKVKYVSRAVNRKYQSLSIDDLISLIKENNLYVEKNYELDNIDDQIKFELFNIIENNFVINKCENCGTLFIPITGSKNKNQKGRTDQKYCDNLYLDTGKTCKEIGALNKRKEKVKNSPILTEFNKEYKRMYGLHYNHSKQFTEKKFKEWSKKANKLKEKYTDDQLEEFKLKLKKLSQKY